MRRIPQVEVPVIVMHVIDGAYIVETPILEPVGGIHSAMDKMASVVEKQASDPVLDKKPKRPKPVAVQHNLHFFTRLPDALTWMEKYIQDNEELFKEDKDLYR